MRCEAFVLLLFLLPASTPAAGVEAADLLGRALPVAPLPQAPSDLPPALHTPVGLDLPLPSAGPDATPPTPALPAPFASAPATLTLAALAGALGAIALYSRLTRSDILAHRHRERLLALIHATPGIDLSELRRAARLGWGTTVYHLDRLERAGHVASQRVGARRCWFAAGAVPRDERTIAAAAVAPSARHLVAAVRAHPGLTQRELCALTGLSASALSKQATRLENAGVLRRERDDIGVRLWPRPAP